MPRECYKLLREPVTRPWKPPCQNVKNWSENAAKSHRTNLKNYVLSWNQRTEVTGTHRPDTKQKRPPRYSGSQISTDENDVSECQKLIRECSEISSYTLKNYVFIDRKQHSTSQTLPARLGKPPGRLWGALEADYLTSKNGVPECQKLIKDISEMPLEMVKNLFYESRNIFPRSGQTISKTVGRQLAQLPLVMEQTNFP